MKILFASLVAVAALPIAVIAQSNPIVAVATNATSINLVDLNPDVVLIRGHTYDIKWPADIAGFAMLDLKAPGGEDYLVSKYLAVGAGTNEVVWTVPTYRTTPDGLVEFHDGICSLEPIPLDGRKIINRTFFFFLSSSPPSHPESAGIALAVKK